MNIFRLITQFINSYGIIRICTIDTDCESLENFEALMALGNLASLVVPPPLHAGAASAGSSGAAALVAWNARPAESVR